MAREEDCLKKKEKERKERKKEKELMAGNISEA